MKTLLSFVFMWQVLANKFLAYDVSFKCSSEQSSSFNETCFCDNHTLEEDLVKARTRTKTIIQHSPMKHVQCTEEQWLQNDWRSPYNYSITTIRLFRTALCPGMTWHAPGPTWGAPPRACSSEAPCSDRSSRDIWPTDGGGKGSSWRREWWSGSQTY